MWDASNAHAWKRLYLEHRASIATTSRTMFEVVGDVARHRPGFIGVGSFGRLAIMYGTFDTVFELRRALQNPIHKLLGFGANTQTSALSGWQNRLHALLDALQPTREELDAASAIQNRFTQQISLQLFVTAQNVLLCTFTPVGDLLIFTGPSSDVAERLEAKQRLLKWVEDDAGRISRRALVHASCLFVQIRSTASRSFDEPISFLIATLTLFTYSLLVSTSPDESIPSIQLDRIWSTKVAQVWVDSEPSTMKGYIPGVGHVGRPETTGTLLEMAEKTLLGLSAWGIAQGFAHFIGVLRMRFGQED